MPRRPANATCNYCCSLSVLIGLSSKAVSLFLNDVNEKKLKGEIDLIDKRAAMIYTQGEHGISMILMISQEPWKKSCGNSG